MIFDRPFDDIIRTGNFKKGQEEDYKDAFVDAHKTSSQEENPSQT